jgi:hypothetical protein
MTGRYEFDRQSRLLPGITRQSRRFLVERTMCSRRGAYFDNDALFRFDELNELVARRLAADQGRALPFTWIASETDHQPQYAVSTRRSNAFATTGEGGESLTMTTIWRVASLLE